MAVDMQNARLLPCHYAVEIGVLLPSHGRRVCDLAQKAVVIRRQKKSTRFVKVSQSY